MEVCAFEKEINSPQRRPFYLVTGGEPSGTRRCLEAARGAVNKGFFQFNYRQLTIEDLDKNGWGSLSIEVTAFPFGPPPKIIVLSLSEGDKPSGENLEAVTKARARINPQTSLILLLRGTGDSRFKFYKDAAKEGCEVDCRVPDKSTLPIWLVERFKERGLNLSPPLARFMVDRVGYNPGILLSEADKLAVYPGPGVQLTQSMIAGLVCLGPTAEIYELASPLSHGSLQAAIPTLLDQLETLKPLPILYALITHFRRLIRILIAVKATGGRASDDELGAFCGAKTFMVKRARTELEGWNLPRLRACLKAFEDAQRAMFTSSVSQELILEALTVKLGCLAKGLTK
jgi:DNA polymerase-3 subunit delta